MAKNPPAGLAGSSFSSFLSSDFEPKLNFGGSLAFSEPPPNENFGGSFFSSDFDSVLPKENSGFDFSSSFFSELLLSYDLVHSGRSETVHGSLNINP